MGLGGITRDSIADLASLVHDDDDASGNEKDQFRRSTGTARLDRPLSFTGERKADIAEEFLLLEEEDEEEQCCVGLNDDGESEPIDARANVTAGNVSNANQGATQPPTPSSDAGMYYQFQYEGYTDYYAEDFSPYYDYDGNGMPGNREEKKNILCCLFAPWMGGEKKEQQHQVQEQVQPQPMHNLEGSERKEVEQGQLELDLRGKTSSPSQAAGVAPIVETSSNQDSISGPGLEKPVVEQEINSINSSDTGIKASPEQEAPTDTPTKQLDVQPQDPTEPNEDDTTQPSVKSILKVKRCINRFNNGTTSQPSKKKDSKNSSSVDGKRQLFPSYEPKNDASSKNEKGNGEVRKIAFNPMARVLTIPSRKDIPLSQKAQVWWQKSDYDDFKKTGRIISKAMECGGSEIWLTSTNAWGKGQQSRAAATKSKKEVENEKLVGKEAETDSEYIKALEKYTGGNKKTNDTSSGNDSNFGDKWWCKFGHSRRGLEHIVSSSEGKARQQSVLLAIEMILEEQKRQRATRNKDPNKLRNVAMQYTSWARDLALAAGAADNEAVESNFDMGAKSRAHHFAQKSKHLLTKDTNAAGGGVAIAITSQILDENTHSRRTWTMSSPPKASKDSHLEHDTSDPSLSKRAKGFIPGESSDVSVSQIMSGMGNSMTPRSALKA